ncbi:MAG: HXXEE domain-containing protein [Pyrinomonadaceae bacterium]
MPVESAFVPFVRAIHCREAVMIYLFNYFNHTNLLYLFPLTYLIHIGEEYRAGYSQYLWRHYGIELPVRRFVALQTLGMVLMTTGVMLALNLGVPNTMLVILAAVTMGNSLIHVAKSTAGLVYEPGLVSSVLIWMPVSSITLVTAWDYMSVTRYAMSCLTGLTICGVIEWIASRGGRVVRV